jgi:hypothetical protein
MESEKIFAARPIVGAPETARRQNLNPTNGLGGVGPDQAWL